MGSADTQRMLLVIGIHAGNKRTCKQKKKELKKIKKEDFKLIFGSEKKKSYLISLKKFL